MPDTYAYFFIPNYPSDIATETLISQAPQRLENTI